MNKGLDNFRGRTDAKLRYAELTLREVHDHESRGSGDDFERAHQEAFLFHLMGVQDALFQELNVRYGCNLTLTEVSWERLSKQLSTMGHENAAFTELRGLRGDANSWLCEAKEYRDHGTHRYNIPRDFAVGGDDDGTVRFRRADGRLMEADVLDAFATWLESMRRLVEKGRL